MKAAVLTSGSISSPGWHVRDLARAAAVLGCELYPCQWRQLTANVGGSGPLSCVARAGELVLDEMDLLLLRTMPAGSLEQIVLRMDIVGQLAVAGVKTINPPRAVEMAVDKYLALSCMAAAGLPVPATVVCQRAEDALNAFETLGRDVVVKPLFGSEGFGLMRLTDPDMAARVFNQLQRMNSVIYLQQFINHDHKQGGMDLRLFVLNGKVAAAMERTHPSDWRTNIARGGQGKFHEADGDAVDLAVRAAAACSAFVAGVDLLVDVQGRRWVIEVNAVPGWRELARVTGQDIASLLLQEALKSP